MPFVGDLALLGRSGRFTDSPAAVCQALTESPAAYALVTMQRCDVATSEEARDCFGSPTLNGGELPCMTACGPQSRMSVSVATVPSTLRSHLLEGQSPRVKVLPLSSAGCLKVSGMSMSYH